MCVPSCVYKFGDFELDPSRFELRRNGRVQRLERIPLELLILLAEKQGDVATRQEIIERLWGKDVFVDTEHGINTAVRKIRQALRDDPEQPRFVQTVTGKGYRFVASASPISNGADTSSNNLAPASSVYDLSTNSASATLFWANNQRGLSGTVSTIKRKNNAGINPKANIHRHP